MHAYNSLCTCGNVDLGPCEAWPIIHDKCFTSFVFEDVLDVPIIYFYLSSIIEYASSLRCQKSTDYL